MRAFLEFLLALSVGAACGELCSFQHSADHFHALENCVIEQWPSTFHVQDEEDSEISSFTVKNVTLSDCSGWIAWLSEWHSVQGSFNETFDIEASDNLLQCLPHNLSLIVARPDGGPRVWLGLQAMAIGNEAVESKLIDDSVQIKVKTLSLQHLELTRVPAINIAVTESLMLSGNVISHIWTRDFDSMNLTALKNLWLDDNTLCYVEASAFRTMTALEHLDLTGNRLAKLSNRFYVYNIVEQRSLPFIIIWNTTRWTHAQNCCAVMRNAHECVHVVVVEIQDTHHANNAPGNSRTTPSTLRIGAASMNARARSHAMPASATNEAGHMQAEQFGLLGVALFVTLVIVFAALLVMERRRSRLANRFVSRIHSSHRSDANVHYL